MSAASPAPTRRFRPWIGAATVLVGAGACGALWWWSPSGRQWRNMREAESFLARIEPGLAADPRFARLEFLVSTSEQIWVRGVIPDQGALDALAARLRAEGPPCPVRSVEIVADDGSLLTPGVLAPARE